MKKGELLALMTILFMGIASAAYGCTEGTIITESDIINIGQIEFINGIRIALFDSGAISADLLIDAKHITLTNESPSVEVELLSGDYDISLINLTEDSAWIEVEGKKKGVGEGELEQIGGLQVYALGLEGTYLGDDANVELFVGKDYQFLYDTKPTSTKTIGGVEYLFELSSSSSEGARIGVKKCENGTLIEIDDPVEDVSNNSGIDNSSLQNDSVQNQLQNESSATDGNITTMDNFTGSEDLQNTEENVFRNNILNLPNILTFIFLVIVIIIVFSVFYNKKNKEGENKPEDTPSSEET